MTVSELARKTAEKAASGTGLAKITVFANARDLAPIADITLSDFIEGIREGKHKEKVDAVRAELDPKKANDLKQRLHAVTLSCTMTSRAKDAPERVRVHSGWLQADFDGKENEGMDQAAARAALMADPHVGAVFVGPSGKGLKAVMRINPDDHDPAFRSAVRHFKDAHGLNMDPACKDVVRLCFASFDPDAWIRDGESQVFKPTAGPATLFTAPPPVTEPTGVLPCSVEDVREMLKFIPPNPPYMKWLEICSAVWSVLPFMEGAQVLQEWSPEEGDGYHKKWRARLKDFKMGTVVHYAKQGGFDPRAAARRTLWIGKLAVGGGAARPAAAPGEPATAAALNAREEMTVERKTWLWDQFQGQQLGDAEIFADKLGAFYAWDTTIDAWRVWNVATGLWRKDLGETTALAIATCVVTEYSALIKEIESSLRASPPASKADTRVEDIKDLRKRIQNLKKSGYCDGVAKMARRLPQMQRDAEQYDRARNLLAIANGVLEFSRSGVSIRGATPEDCLTHGAPVTHDQGAECPLFDAFLHTAFMGDEELVAYWWRVVGYCLTGYVDHDVLFFNYGSGSNGKSTANNVVRALLGKTLCSSAKVSLLLGDDYNGQADYQLAALEGKRAVYLDELPAKRAINASMVKTLLGGEPIQARNPFERPREIEPTHKIFMTGNHKPRISDTDHGIWRRIHLIPWLNTIPEGKRRDRTELLAEFCTELPGILNRAIDGFYDFIDRGRKLDPPKAVLDATDEYRDEENQLSHFLQETIVEAPGESLMTTEVFKKYVHWCEANGERPNLPTNAKFTQSLRIPPHSIRIERGTDNKNELIDFAWREAVE